MQSSELIIVRETVGAAAVLHIFDTIDATNEREFAGELERVVGRPCIIVELSRCRSIDRSGLDVLARMFRLCGKRLRVVAPFHEAALPGPSIAQSYGFLPLFDTLEAALRVSLDGRIAWSGRSTN
ncbi:MAG: STAS domain-containing protein [Candidatus Eremiobacteraeota bacterium]|nr:STAS domain-containing protein [Candidatus Eremiobacteraeota bacterium]